MRQVTKLVRDTVITEVVQLMKNEWLELGHHHLATPSELMNLGNNHQWLRTITGLYVPPEGSTQNPGSFLAQKAKSESGEASRSNYSL